MIFPLANSCTFALMISNTPKTLRKIFPPEVIWELPNADNKVYLSFDDGPIPEVTPQVLKLLKQHQAKATFFMVGENVEKHPEILQQVLEDGHGVGNHSYNHVKGWETKDQDYYANIQKAAKLIPGQLFRPPHGQMMPRQAKVLVQDYTVIMWSLLTEDYHPKNTPEDVIRRIEKRLQAGSIVVFHDSLKAEKNMLAALQWTLQYIRSKGFTTDIL
jgi:peptidoglycan/xylan/chitin deacetylase (PgdA/CDA1 family)